MQEADVLLVNGGDPLYLCHWMRESGLAALLPSLDDTVWVGLSAGSMVMTPRIGADFVQLAAARAVATRRWASSTSRSSRTWTTRCLPDNTMADAEAWAAAMSAPCYAIDDETAIRAVDGNVDVISEGTWRLFS